MPSKPPAATQAGPLVDDRAGANLRGNTGPNWEGDQARSHPFGRGFVRLNPPGSWLAQMLARKPRMLVAVALANKTARIVWALLATGGIYRAPSLAA